jgi:arsenic resistance protein ArsH
VRLLRYPGCETLFFDPAALHLPNSISHDYPQIVELRDLAAWLEGMVWSSPERHGAMTGIMKTQIDWLPLSLQSKIRPMQGKTLAMMQVSGGLQSFNATNYMQILGRWMQMVSIPRKSIIPKAWLELDDSSCLPKWPFYSRIVDVIEELVEFTWLVRGRSDYLVDRYSERVENVDGGHTRVSLINT